MDKRISIIGIAGPSGAGKSQFANKLLKHLLDSNLSGKASLIQEDSYYKDQSHLQTEERDKTNYDHPNAFDHDLMSEQIRAFLNGERVEVPIYDYTIHNRSPETSTLTPGSILIIEGILIFHDQEMRELMDLKVFIDVPLDICLERRIQRDTKNRGREVDSIVQRFEKTVRPMYTQFVEPTKDFADLIVPGGGGNDTAIDVLVQYLVALHT